MPIDLFVRGISCILPGVEGYTDRVREVSIVGQLLEHSRVYGFGPREDCKLYLSSADLMTRNMDKRIEIAWPILNETLRNQVLGYLGICYSDTAKLRELLPDGSYTALGAFAERDENGEVELFDSQEVPHCRGSAHEARVGRAGRPSGGQQRRQCAHGVSARGGGDRREPPGPVPTRW